MLAAATSIWQDSAALIGILVGVGGIIATGIFYGVVHGQAGSVEFLKTANEGLRDALNDAGKKSDDQLRQLEHKLGEETRRCASETAELRGQVAMLQDGVVQSVASAAAETVAKGLVSDLLHQLDARQREYSTQLLTALRETPPPV